MYRVHPIHWKGHAKVAQYWAEQLGVTVEHLLETVRKRKYYRHAKKWYRQRARMRTRQNNPLSDVRAPKDPTLMREGEGELHGYLRTLGLSIQQFSDLVGMNVASVKAWSGHPLYRWPCEFLRMYGWTINMSAKLRELGYDPEQMKPPIPSKRLKKNVHPTKKNPLILVMPGEYSPYKK